MLHVALSDFESFIVPKPWRIQSARPVKARVFVALVRDDDFADADYPWTRDEMQRAFQDCEGSAPAVAIVLGCSTRQLRRWLTLPRYRDIPEVVREVERVARYRAIDSGERARGTEIREQRGLYGYADAERDCEALEILARQHPRDIGVGLLASCLQYRVRDGRRHAPVYLVTLFATLVRDDVRRRRIVTLLEQLDWVPPAPLLHIPNQTSAETTT